MPLRIIVKGLKEMDNSFETLNRIAEEIDAEKNPMLKGFTNNVLEPNKFSSVYGLLGHKQEKFAKEDTLIAIVIAYLLATETRFFGSKMNYDWEALSLDKNFVLVVGLLEEIMVRSGNNVFGTYEKDTGFRVIIPALSFFSHSCNPMIIRTTHNNYIASRVFYPIKKGQQIFDTYGLNYMMMPKRERQAKLLSDYNFLCDCEACENDWSDGSEFNYDERDFEKMSPLFFKACSLFHDIQKKCKAIKDKKNVYLDIEKDVAHVVTSFAKIFRHHRQNYSCEINMSRAILLSLFELICDKLLSLDNH